MLGRALTRRRRAQNTALKTTWSKVSRPARRCARQCVVLAGGLAGWQVGGDAACPPPRTVQVNRDFSSIFHTLLPNAKCKLEPPEGGSVLDGLVLRVGFGDCWKVLCRHAQRHICAHTPPLLAPLPLLIMVALPPPVPPSQDSLSELSGGQRSLLALSLILALLLFKPAPMYILDEVRRPLALARSHALAFVCERGCRFRVGSDEIVSVSLVLSFCYFFTGRR